MSQIIAALIMLVPATLWRAYAAVLVYAWYAPTSWPALTMRGALCGSILGAFFHSHRKGKDTETDAMDIVLLPLLYPALIIGMAWLFRALTMAAGWWPEV